MAVECNMLNSQTNNHRKTIGNIFGKLWSFLWKRYVQKLRSITPVQFEPMTFRFAYGRTLKPLTFMISGFLDVSMSPKTNMIYLWRPQDTK